MAQFVLSNLKDCKHHFLSYWRTAMFLPATQTQADQPGWNYKVYPLQLSQHFICSVTSTSAPHVPCENQNGLFSTCARTPVLSQNLSSNINHCFDPDVIERHLENKQYNPHVDNKSHVLVYKSRNNNHYAIKQKDEEMIKLHLVLLRRNWCLILYCLEEEQETFASVAWNKLNSLRRAMTCSKN